MRKLRGLKVATFASSPERFGSALGSSDVVAVVPPLRGGGGLKRLERRVRIATTLGGWGNTYPTSWPYSEGTAEILDGLRPFAPFNAIVARSFLAPFVDQFRALGPVILDAEDAEHIVVKELRGLSHSRLSRAVHPSTVHAMTALMRRFYPKADEVWLPSSLDAHAVRELVPEANVMVVPNVVAIGPRPTLPSDREGKTILFVGNRAYPPNESAVNELVHHIFPRIVNAIPTAVLQIVGKEGEVVFAPSNSVQYVGEVPSLDTYYDGARIAVLPVRHGTGPKLKVIEALAQGVPIIATSKAISGLDLRPGIDVLVAESPSDLADLAITLLRDDTLADKLARAGRKAAEAGYSMEALDLALSYSQVARTPS